MPHNPHTQWFEDTLYKLEGFSHLVETMLAGEIAKLEAHLEVQAKELNEKDKAEYFEYHAEDFFELSNQLPSIHRYSIITAADSALETYLTDTCNTYAQVEGSPIRLSDFAGKGLPRAQQYLKKVAKISFPDSLPAWTAILRLRELRNSIVHADGQLQGDQSALSAWIRSESDISLSTDRTVTIHSGFTDRALSWYRTFSAALDKATEPLGLWGAIFPFEKPDASGV